MASAIAALCKTENSPSTSIEKLTSTLEPSYTTNELYALQMRHGKLKPPSLSYAQRNSLKAKFRLNDGPKSSIRHSAYIMVQDLGSILNALIWSPGNFLSWLSYRLWEHALPGTDIRCGRKRIASLRSGTSTDIKESLAKTYLS